MKIRYALAIALSLAAFAPQLRAEDEGQFSGVAKDDEKTAYFTYFGSASKLVEPEFAAATISVTTACQKSADAAQKLVEPLAATYWAKIASIVVKPDVEANRLGWNSPVTTGAVAVDQRIDTDPKDEKKSLVRWEDECNGAMYPAEAKAPVWFTSTQRFTIATSDMASLEKLAKEISALKQSSAKNAVHVHVLKGTGPMASVPGIEYRLTLAKQKEIYEALQAKAREEAHKGQFLVDKENLKLIKAHDGEGHVMYAPSCEPEIEGALDKDGVPIARVRMGFRCSLYTKAKGLIEPPPGEEQESRGSMKEITEAGTASAPADFASMNFSISALCAKDGTALTAAANKVEQDLADRINALQKDLEDGEDNKFDRPASFPANPYTQIEMDVAWKQEGNLRIVTERMDPCTGVRAAVAQGAPAKKAEYFSIQRNLQLKTSNLKNLRAMLAKIATDYPTKAGAGAIAVNVANLTWNVTTATKQKLYTLARNSATKVLLSKDGSLKREISARGYTFACIKDVRGVTGPIINKKGGGFGGVDYGSPTSGNLEAAPVAGRSAAVADSANPKTPGEPKLVKKPGSERPGLFYTLNFGFPYRVQSADYVDVLK